ncbi:hypothetical protein BJX66DRAFT_342614 [Aspergillus keveii]|uniref:Uncharacterized protein n=1 Tax=Aspergillus keveii TaxID=714993 RepID=A0ABR4FRR3_9EURO
MPDYYTESKLQLVVLDNLWARRCIVPATESSMHEITSVNELCRPGGARWFCQPVKDMEPEITLTTPDSNMEMLIADPGEDESSIRLKTCCKYDKEHQPAKNAVSRWKFNKLDNVYEIINSKFEDKRLSMDRFSQTIIVLLFTSTSVPLYICAALYIIMAIVARIFPFEPMVRRSS